MVLKANQCALSKLYQNCIKISPPISIPDFIEVTNAHGPHTSANTVQVSDAESFENISK